MDDRTTIAAKAMQGILAGKASNEEAWARETPSVTATLAYAEADAMLAARQTGGAA